MAPGKFKGTILLIDDEDEIRAVIATILTDAGFQVKAGRDVTALYEIEKDPPNLLLIDNWLDGKTGHDICFQLKTSPKTQAIPVVLISATINLAQTAQSCLADGYIRKPFDLDELVATVTQYIR